MNDPLLERPVPTERNPFVTFGHDHPYNVQPITSPSPSVGIGAYEPERDIHDTEACPQLAENCVAFVGYRPEPSQRLVPDGFVCLGDNPMSSISGMTDLDLVNANVIRGFQFCETGK